MLVFNSFFNGYGHFLSLLNGGGQSKILRTAKFSFSFLVLFVAIVQPVRSQTNCFSGIETAVYGTTGGSILISQLPAVLPSFFTIRGTLIVDQHTTWSGKQVNMQIGSKIQINSGVSFMLSGSSLESCTYMWKGVTMSGGAVFVMSGGFISDAITAVESVGENSISISGGAKLLRNYHGLSFLNLNKPFTPMLSSLTIDGKGPFKPEYFGQPASEIKKIGIIGIKIENMASYTIAGAKSVTVKNYGEQGVYAKNSAGILTGVVLEDIFESNIHRRPVIKGNGILVEGGSRTTIDDCVFRRSHIGIEILNTAFDVKNNIMETMDGGISCAYALPGTNSITYNIIKNCWTGIVAQFNVGAVTQINNNTIENASRCGIFLDDMLLAVADGIFSGYEVSNCTITISNNAGLIPSYNEGAVGILATRLAARGPGAVFICSNTIYLPHTDSKPENVGIHMTSVHSLYVNKNNISQGDKNPTLKHTGIYMHLVDKTAVGCNKTTNTNVGMETGPGESCIQMYFHTNEFRDHQEAGIKFNGQFLSATYQFNPITNGGGFPHIHQGNLWLYNTDATRPGVVQTALQFSQTMTFIVDRAENPAFFPFVDDQNLFFDQSTAAATRTCPVGQCGGQAELEGNEPDFLTEQTISNAPVFANTMDALHWSSELHALDYIASRGNAATATQMAFWNSRYATSQGIAARMNKVGREWQAANGHLTVAIAQKREALKTAIENGASEAEIQNKQTALAAAIDAYKSAMAVHLSVLSALNNEMPEGSAFDRDLKSVHAAALSVLSNSEWTPTETEEAELRRIAVLCPNVAGPTASIAQSVLMATLLEWVPGTKCSPAQERNHQMMALVVSIFPNPIASGMVNISTTGLHDQELQLDILDVSGRIMAQRKVPGNTVTSVDVSTLGVGLYFVRCSAPSGHIRFTSKMIVQP